MGFFSILSKVCNLTYAMYFFTLLPSYESTGTYQNQCIFLTNIKNMTHHFMTIYLYQCSSTRHPLSKWVWFYDYSNPPTFFNKKIMNPGLLAKTNKAAVPRTKNCQSLRKRTDLSWPFSHNVPCSLIVIPAACAS